MNYIFAKWLKLFIGMGVLSIINNDNNKIKTEHVTNITCMCKA